MEIIALKSLLAGSSVRLGLTGKALNDGLKKAVNRVQVIAHTEDHHLLSEDAQVTIFLLSPSIFHAISASAGAEKNEFATLIKKAEVACLVLPGISQMPNFLPRFASEIATPVLCSCYDEYLLASRLTGLLQEKLHHRIQTHGALVNMYGLGVLITGESGCGKTTGALELAKRGHKWIADDAVEIVRGDGNLLYGRCHARSKGLLEIKGQGIMKAGEMLPAVTIGEQTPLDLIVEMKKSFRFVPASSRRGYRKIMGMRLPVLRYTTFKLRNWSSELEHEVRLMRRMG